MDEREKDPQQDTQELDPSEIPGEGLDNVGAEDRDTTDGDPQSERADK